MPGDLVGARGRRGPRRELRIKDFHELVSLRRGPKWIFRYGEAETTPLPSRLWLFGMYVVM